MSCREHERLFVSGASEADVAAHRKACGECARLGWDLDEARLLTDGLTAPRWTPGLRAALLEIPRQTVTCEGAEMFLAAAVDDELAGADRLRLDSHLSRCGACTAAANVLLSMRELEAPAPPAWLATRLTAARPARPVSRWRGFLSGRAVVAYAYAAAILVMVMGWNPTAVVKKASFASLGVSTRNAVTVAESSLTDRLGALQEKAARTFAVWKGHIGGYGRAAVSNAIAIVSRPETKKTPTRPRLGKDSGAAGLEGFSTAHAARREPLPSRFRV
jgi:putative zinc finger protein